MARRLLLFVLLLCICFTIINCKSQCSCSCCKGNRCIKQFQGVIQVPTCSAASCKSTCKLRHPGQCGHSPGSLTATCTKTKTPHQSSAVKKIKQKFIQSPKKPIHLHP